MDLGDFVPENSIALTVTSPPYFDAIDYGSHDSENPGQWYRGRSPGAKYDDFLVEIGAWFRNVYEVTMPGGCCAVVVGTVIKDGRHYSLPHDLCVVMQEHGWCFKEEIIWFKVTAGVKRARVMVQHPKPGYYYPNIMHEHILIFYKDGPKIYERLGAPEIDLDYVWKHDIANSMWCVAPVPPKTISHPAPFPEEIPYRLIQMYSNPGDVVMDPFSGSGRTLKVAKHLGRRWFGLDIKPEYVECSMAALEEPFVRRRQLIANWRKYDTKTETLT